MDSQDALIKIVQELTKENLDLKSQISNNTVSQSDYYNSARLLTEIATLEDEPRKVKYLSPFAKAPSVTDQIDGVLVIGKRLSSMAMANYSDVNPNRITNLLLWHDAPEVRYGDLGRDQRRYISINEDKARFEMFGSVFYGEEIIDLIEDFENGGEDINIKLAKDADALYVIYTIQNLIEQKFFVNEPKTRIEKTLKRITSEEGLELGREMAKRTPDNIWKFVGFEPKKSLSLIMTTAWILFELGKHSDYQNMHRDKILDDILENNSSLFIDDCKEVIQIAEQKRKYYGKNDLNKVMAKSLNKINTLTAKEFAKALINVDLYEWWNISMGYLTVNPDGTVNPKLR